MLTYRKKIILPVKFRLVCCQHNSSFSFSFLLTIMKEQTLKTTEQLPMQQSKESGMENSRYTQISKLNSEHGIYLVKDNVSGDVYVQKTLDVFNRDVFERIRSCPVAGIPAVKDLYESDGRLVVIEEFIQGMNCREMLEGSGPMSEDKVRSIALRLCDILAALHSFSPAIIHRDIKPSNVMITPADEVYLIDLDAAKAVVEGQTHDTQLIGTQGYAAPEQYGFGASTVQTDIYGTGRLMQTLLTGNPDMQVNDECSLKQIIEMCTQIDPRDRFRSAAALKAALTQSLELNSYKTVPAGSPQKRRKRKFLLLSIAAALVLVLLPAVLFLSLRSTGNSDNVRNLSADPSQDTSELTDSDASSSADISADDAEPDTTTAVGVYSGDYDEKLVIADNGYAYYYCDTLTYSEPECKWYEQDGKIYIELEKLRCTIYAKVSSGNYSKLTFKSDSSNWNSEKFKKISSDYNSYILSSPPSASSIIEVLENGDMQFSMGDIQFTAPKTFLDYGDDFQTHYQVILIDNDVTSGYIGCCMFYNDVSYFGMDSYDPSDQSEAEAFALQFFDDVETGSPESVTIAGEEAYSFDVTGKMNDNFSELKGCNVSGKLYRISNDETPELISILMIQTPDRGIDDTELFEDILQSAVKL